MLLLGPPFLPLNMQPSSEQKLLVCWISSSSPAGLDSWRWELLQRAGWTPQWLWALPLTVQLPLKGPPNPKKVKSRISAKSREFVIRDSTKTYPFWEIIKELLVFLFTELLVLSLPDAQLVLNPSQHLCVLGIGCLVHPLLYFGNCDSFLLTLNKKKVNNNM